MYLEPTIPRKKKRRSSPVRVAILLALIAVSLYVYSLVKHEEAVTPFVPTPTPTRPAASYIAEAEELYLRGELTQAIAAYEQAITLEPTNPRPYIPLARLLTLEGRFDEAIYHARQAVNMSPQSAPAWAVLGMAYDWEGDFDQAIEACKHAVDLDPGYAEGYSYLAEAYADAGRWVEANQAIETALRLNEHSVDVQRNHGYVLEVQGYYRDAQAAYRRALEIHPYLPHIHIALGRIHRKLGDVDAALESFQKAAEIDPNEAQAHFEQGWTYLIHLGNYELAETHLKQAIAVNPRFGRAFGALAITYWQRRNYEGAIPNFEQAIYWECVAARQRARGFFITAEEKAGGTTPSSSAMMRGEFVPLKAYDRSLLLAVLRPEAWAGETWAGATGTVTLDTHSGVYTVTLRNPPRPAVGVSYTGWFDGLRALSGSQVSTGPLRMRPDGSIEATFETGWVRGPAIEYFYTLGLAYFYKDECKKAYPLFDAALQIDPDEANALDGIRLCRQIEGRP